MYSTLTSCQLSTSFCRGRFVFLSCMSFCVNTFGRFIKLHSTKPHFQVSQQDSVSKSPLVHGRELDFFCFSGFYIQLSSVQNQSFLGRSQSILDLSFTWLEQVLWWGCCHHFWPCTCTVFLVDKSLLRCPSPRQLKQSLDFLKNSTVSLWGSSLLNSCISVFKYNQSTVSWPPEEQQLDLFIGMNCASLISIWD